MYYVKYEDENNITRCSAYQYESLESFYDMCKKNCVNTTKMKNIRLSEEGL